MSQRLSELFGYKVIQLRLAEIDAACKQKKVEKAYLPTLVDSETLVGLEVEVERVSQSAPTDGDPLFNLLWQVKPDGSLRNDGLEFVSNPIAGANVPLAINNLHALLTTFNKVDFSSRTSVHVHVNVREMTVEQIFKLLLVYLVIERSLYYYVFDRTNVVREDNIFCVPIRNCLLGTAAAGGIMSYSRKQDKSALGELLNTWKKYTGLNILPITTLGTLEFRHMSGTIKPGLLVEWINLLLSLKQFAKRQQTFIELRDSICELNTNSQYEKMLRDVFGELHRVFPAQLLVDQMESGVMAVKTSLLGRDTPTPLTLDVFRKSSLGNYLRKQGLNIDADVSDRKKLIAEAVETLRGKRLEFDRILRELTVVRGDQAVNRELQREVNAQLAHYRDRAMKYEVANKHVPKSIADQLAHWTGENERAEQDRLELINRKGRADNEWENLRTTIQELVVRIPTIGSMKEFQYLSAFIKFPSSDPQPAVAADEWQLPDDDPDDIVQRRF